MSSLKTHPELIIDAKHIQKGYFKSLIQNRELFYFLAWRDIIVRYKQAFFGVAWALFRPLLNMLAFTLLFNRIAHLQSGNVNYALFVFAGMLPWQFFSGSVIDTSHSLLTNASLITKTYFPRMLIPLAQLGVHFLDFLIGFSAFLILMPILGNFPGWSLLLLPFFILELFLLTGGISLWFSAITVQFRDLRFIVPFLIQFGIFVSPVGYSSGLIPEKWQWLFFFNPLVGIIDGFRFSFFGEASPQFFHAVLSSFIGTLLIAFSGYFYFRKKESSFADFI
ncbi:MAG TPA: ABC transporter permease [Parachlamydiaceae bacterium]|nr:ABC transporter permease [Parachlamydiaceae bacterium]